MSGSPSPTTDLLMQSSDLAMLQRTPITSLVVIDSAVENAAQLVQGLVPGVGVVMLAAEADGVVQITQALAQYSTVTELHIIAHGAPGRLMLGDRELSLSSLPNYRSALATWFPEHCSATLLLYGCNVAAGDAGEEFLWKLQSLTGARVAASTTKVGNVPAGGNWSLDLTTADFTPQLAITEATQAVYGGSFDWFQAEQLLADFRQEPERGTQSTSRGDVDAFDSFGTSVAIYGDFAFVGVPGNSDINEDLTTPAAEPLVSNAGSVYVFKIDPTDGSWSKETMLIAGGEPPLLPADNDATPFAEFGRSVDATEINGDIYLAVGAPGALTPAANPAAPEEKSGAVYILKRSAATGQWTQVQEIVHVEPAGLTGAGRVGDRFGEAVSIDGTDLVVGAPGDENAAGAFYVYRSADGSAWTSPEGKQDNPAPDGAATNGGASEQGDSFGAAVAIADGRIIVGAPRAEVAGQRLDPVTGQVVPSQSVSAGAAYIYDAATLALEDTITGFDDASDVGRQLPEAGDDFGISVDISGGVAIVGSSGNGIFIAGENNNQPYADAGAAYIFSPQGTDWSQIQQLTGSDNTLRAGDQFGISVGIDEGVAVVGSYTEEDNYDDPTFVNEIPPTGDPNQAPAPRLPKPGVTYIYEPSETVPGAWDQTERLLASDRVSADSFGNAVDVYTSPLGSSTIVVGAETKNLVLDSEGLTRDVTGPAGVPDGFDDGNDFARLDPGDPANTLDPDGWRDVDQAGAAYIFRSQPQVQSVTPNVFFINDQLVLGANPNFQPDPNDAIPERADQFLLTVVYDQPMNTAINPTISFPNNSESPGQTLANNAVPVGGVWTDPNTYVAIYDIQDLDAEQFNIDIAVNGGVSVGGSPQVPAEPPNAVVTDIFSIDTRNPIPLAFNPFEVRTNSDPAVNPPELPSTFINRPFSVAGSFDQQVSPAENPFNEDSFAVTNGFISGFFFDGGGTYNFNVTPLAEGEVIVDLNPFKASDFRFNPTAPDPASIVLTYDITPPEVSLAPTGFDPAVPVNGTFSGIVTLSEEPVGFDESDLIVTNAVIQPGSFMRLPDDGDPTTTEVQYSFVIDPTGNGAAEVSVGVEVLPAAFTDLATNVSLGSAPNNINVTYDGLRPTVTLSAVTDVVEGPFTVQVVFSEAVTDLELQEFFVTNGVATALSGSGSTYSVEIDPTLAGPVTIALADNVAFDVATNPSLASNILDVTYAPPFPEVVSVTPSAATITDSEVVGGTFTLTVVYTEGMDPASTPVFAFPTLDEDPSQTLQVAGGVWTSPTTYEQSFTLVDANVELTAIDVTVSGGVSASTGAVQNPDPTLVADLFNVETTNPEVVLTADAAINPVTNTSIFTVLATFSHPVTNFDLADVQITNGVAVGAVTAISDTEYSVQVEYGATDDTTLPIEVAVIAGANEIPSGNLNQPSAVLSIDDVNDPPEISAPTTPLQAFGNTRFIFSEAEGNAISISDPDAGTQPVIVNLAVTAGQLFVVNNPSVTITNNGTSSVSLTGSQADINAALDGLAYKPVNLRGTESLTIAVNDQGNFGSGTPVPRVDSEVLSIEVEELTRHDFDGDRNSDFLWRESDIVGDNVFWFIEDTVSFAGRGAIAAGPVPDPDFKIQGTGDLNLDGKQDIIWRNFRTAETLVWFMDGGNFLGAAQIRNENRQDAGWFVESVADINRDGKADLLWRNRATNTIVAWYLDSGQNGDNIPLLGGEILQAPGVEWQIQGMGDFNGDDNPDIVWRNTDNGSVVLWYMDGLTVLPGSGEGFLSGGANITPPGLEWEIQGVGDYNSDGNPDLVWRNQGASKTTIWTAQGRNVTGSFSIEPDISPAFELGLN